MGATMERFTTSGKSRKWTPELAFSSADGWFSAELSGNKNISQCQHRGIANQGMFFKGQYVKCSPLKDDFSFVDKDKASYEYVKAIEETNKEVSQDTARDPS